MTGVPIVSASGIAARPCLAGRELRSQLKSLIQNEQLLVGSDFFQARSRAVCFGNRLYLIRDHQTAPLHWAEALVNGQISYLSRILHADMHPDTGTSVAAVDQSILGADGGLPISPTRLYAEAVRVVKANDSYADLVPENNLIGLGTGLKLIGEYVHLIPGDGGEFPGERLPVPSRTMTLAYALKNLRFERQRTEIGDLDLDFFSRLDGMLSRQANLEADLDHLVQLFSLADPGVITVAFSPQATSGRDRYNSRSLEENVEIVARLIEGLGIDAQHPRLIVEPRGDLPCSPK
jgi:hypothetical protein